MDGRMETEEVGSCTDASEVESGDFPWGTFTEEPSSTAVVLIRGDECVKYPAWESWFRRMGRALLMKATSLAWRTFGG